MLKIGIHHKYVLKFDERRYCNVRDGACGMHWYREQLGHQEEQLQLNLFGEQAKETLCAPFD